MTATKMAPIKIVSGGQELGRIEPENIMRVLLIEDDISVRDNTVRKLQESGYSVDAFTTPREAAQNLAANRYQLVIVDIRFDAPNISGDEFIYKNKDMLESAKVVAFTGHEDDIVHHGVFDEIFVKGMLRDDLFDYAEDAYLDRQKELASQIECEIAGNTKAQLEKISGRPKEELIRILNETKDKEKKIVWYKGGDYSANDLIKEVEDETSAVGKSHIRMMVDWLARKNRS